MSTPTLFDCDRSRAGEILAILNEEILNSTALYDYRQRTMESMSAWFDAKEKGQFPVIGATDDTGRLLGFATYGAFRMWPAYKYSVEHSLYVAADARRRGIGGQLLAAVVTRATEGGYHNLIAGIDADNGASIALHQRFGFAPCGVVRHAGFKFGRWLDLAFYQRLLDAPATPTDG